MALYAFYFLGTRPALAQLAYIGAAYAVVLIETDPPSPLIRWLLVVGTPLIAGMLIVRVMDRVRMGRAESEERAVELRESEQRTELVLDSAPDAFVTIDSAGVIRGWNSAAERIFGWTAAQAIGEQMRDADHPSRVPRPPRRAPPGAGGRDRHRRADPLRGRAPAP